MTKIETSPMHVSTGEWAAMLSRWYGSPDNAITELNRLYGTRTWLEGVKDDWLDKRAAESREDVLGQLALMAVAE